MRVKVLFVCLLFAGGVCAQVSEGIEKNKVYQGFSGGMMLHTKSRILVMSSAIHSMPRGSISATHWKTTSCTSFADCMLLSVLSSCPCCHFRLI